MLLIPISPLILLLVQPTLMLSRFFSLQCSLLFAICLFLLLSCLLLLLHTVRLVVPLLSNMFSMTEFVIMLNFFFFIISFFCPSNAFLFACTITPRYFSSSTTSILLISTHFSSVLNRMHRLFLLI